MVTTAGLTVLNRGGHYSRFDCSYKNNILVSHEDHSFLRHLLLIDIKSFRGMSDDFFCPKINDFNQQLLQYLLVVNQKISYLYNFS